jgi:endonuclease G
MDEQAMQQAQVALDKVRDEWMEREGVTAVDLGFEWAYGEMTGRLAIRVHVANKKAPEELSEAELFPKEVDGVPVDVIEATYGIQLTLEGGAQLEAAIDGRGQRFPEIPLGVSVGCAGVTAGTLGAKVYDTVTQEAYILSNWHVLVGAPNSQPGEVIWQPGRLDGGQSSDKIAEVSRSLLGPFDAALARITGERPILDTTLEGDSIADVVAPRLGMMVWKSGRTTGRTRGFIDGVMMSTQINYGTAGLCRLEQVFRIIPRPDAPNSEVSAGGDSGAIWVDEASGKAVGLHFAGEVGDAPEFALAHDINPVMTRLNFIFPAQVLPPAQPSEPEPPLEPEPPPPIEPTNPPPSQPTPVTRPQKLSWWARFLQWLKHLFGG